MKKLKRMRRTFFTFALVFLVGTLFSGCAKEDLKTVGDTKDEKTLILKNESGVSLAGMRLLYGEEENPEKVELAMSEPFAMDERRTIHLPNKGETTFKLVLTTEKGEERIVHEFPPADMKEGAIRFDVYEEIPIAFLAYISEENKEDKTTRERECKEVDRVKKEAEERKTKEKKEIEKIEAERKAKEKAQRKEKEEAERKAQEEAAENNQVPATPVVPDPPTAPVAPTAPAAPAAPPAAPAPTVNDGGCVNDAILN